MEAAVQIKLVRENLALAIALWAAAQKGVITAGFVPNRSEFVAADGRVVKVSSPLEVHDTQELVRCVNNQVRGAFAFSALQTNRVLESIYGNSPIRAADSDLQAARCILYLLSKSVTQDLMSPAWVCPPEYRRRFGVQAVSFVLDASQIDGKKLGWDDFGGLKKYLDLLEYCSVEAASHPTEATHPAQAHETFMALPAGPIGAAPAPEVSSPGGLQNESYESADDSDDSLSEDTEASSMEATPEAGDEADSIASFVETCCVVSPKEMIIAKELYDVYLAWCREQGREPLVQRSFGMQLTSLGFQRRRRGRGRHWWLGIGVKETVRS